MVAVLIVGAMVVVLSAIMVPMLRESAGSARTVANLRQIQAANLKWADDNNGFFLGNAPSGAGVWSHPWWSHMPFLSKLGVSSNRGELEDAWTTGYPEVLKCGLDVSVDASPRDGRNFTIAMNMTGWTHKQDGTPVANRMEYFGIWNAGKLLQSRIKNPSQLIMFYESATFTGYMYDRLEWKGDHGTQSPGMAFRNQGRRCNVVFADGHVRGLERKDVENDNPQTERYFWWDADHP